MQIDQFCFLQETYRLNLKKKKITFVEVDGQSSMTIIKLHYNTFEIHTIIVITIGI